MLARTLAYTLTHAHTHSRPTRVANDAAHHERGKNLLNYELSPEPPTRTQTHIQCAAPSLSLFLTPALSHSLSLCPLSVPPSVCVCV